jgi:uncharacterized protein (DUF433 family)
MLEAATFTAAEVAFVLGEPVKAVKKALDEGPVRARLIRKAGGAVRAVDWADLLYLYAVRALREELTTKARAEFHRALTRVAGEQVHEVRFGRLSVAIDDLQVEVRKRARALTRLARKVEFRHDGEAVLGGTNVEVHRVAALLGGGMTAEQICADYPSLTPQAVATAKAYADAYPKVGRPYPSRTVKRTVARAGLEALDEVSGRRR